MTIHPLKTWLRQNRMTVDDFAARAGVSDATVYNIMLGHGSRTGTLTRLSSATGGAVSVIEMVSWHLAHKGAA